MTDEAKIDWSKPVQTRDGCKARVICTDRKGVYPIVALVEERGSEESLYTYRVDGRWLADATRPESFDLINVPPSALDVLREGLKQQASRETSARDEMHFVRIAIDRAIAILEKQQ